VSAAARQCLPLCIDALLAFDPTDPTQTAQPTIAQALANHINAVRGTAICDGNDIEVRFIKNFFRCFIKMYGLNVYDIKTISTRPELETSLYFSNNNHPLRHSPKWMNIRHRTVIGQ
jgi:hypothetical protein